MQKIDHLKKPSTGKIYVLVILFILLLGYFIPIAIHPDPLGTDVYTHIVYTDIMLESKSIKNFYEKCLEKEDISYDYPFGLWLFGAIVSKLTGIDTYTLSYLLPIMLILLLVLVFYVYSGILISSVRYRMMSVIFLLSMPVIAIEILEYRTSVFSMPIILSVFYFLLEKKTNIIKTFLLSTILVFCLCFIHTGSYMFLMFFSFAYLIISALLWGHFDKKAFILVVTVLLAYAITTTLFPYIHPQYTDKTRMLTTVGADISSRTGILVARDITQIIYDRIFLEKSFLEITLLLGSVYTATQLIVYLRVKAGQFYRTRRKAGNVGVTIPFIGSIQNVSHSITATPFWIGPIHSILAFPGALRLDRNGKGVFISALMVTLLPAASSSGITGALREIFYLFVIIPIASAVGLRMVVEKIGPNPKKKFLVGLLFFTIFSSAILAPAVGNIYYKPPIAGSENERNSLLWLKGYGEPTNGVSGWGYRHMITVYANKEVPEATRVASGSEMTKFTDNLDRIYFYPGSENNVEDMYGSFGISYFLSSDRTMKSFPTFKRNNNWNLTIDSNKQLDRIYTGDSGLGIYSHIQVKSGVKYDREDAQMISFNEASPEIKDVGSDFLISSQSYKIRLGKNSPKLKYLGDLRENYLGEGDFFDYLKIFWYGQTGVYAGYIPADMNFSVSIQDNQITYKKTLMNSEGTANWASLIIKYAFYENAIKNEVIVANDWLYPGRIMNVFYTTKGFIPYSKITYENWNGARNEKKVYPTDDMVSISASKYKSLFFNDGSKGIYFKYVNTAPFPESIGYNGVKTYNYSIVEVNSESFIYPGKAYHMTRYISVGDEKNAADSANYYSSFDICPYQNASSPIMLTGYIENPIKVTDADLANMTNAYKDLADAGVTGGYTEAIGMGEEKVDAALLKDLKGYGIRVTGYRNVPVDRMIDTAFNSYGMELEGFMPEDFGHNMEDINSSIERGLSYIESTPINPPFQEVFQEGLRRPQFAFLGGRESDLVMFPISNPISFDVIIDRSPEKSIATYQSLLDSVITNDDAAVLVWRSKEIGREEYRNVFLETIKYAKEKNMSFTNPIEVSTHMRLMRNVSVTISKNVDSLLMKVSNRNREEVKGASFRAVMPAIKDICPYVANNGKIVRTEKREDYCICYIMTDLKAGENKTVLIEANVVREKFALKLVKGPTEGEIIFSVKNQKGNPVFGATVSINNQKLSTDGLGLVKVDLDRGIYLLKVEKAGFEGTEYKFEVKGLLYFLEKPFN